jgi:hypothetical protein
VGIVSRAAGAGGAESKGDGAPAAAAGNTPAREMLRMIPWLAAWTIVYAAGYACVGAASYPQHPWDSTNRPPAYGMVDGYLWPYRGRSVHTVTLEPASEAYRRITITENREASFRGWRSAPQLRWTGDSANTGLTVFTLSMQLDLLNGQTATMEVDPANLSYRFANPTDATSTNTGTLDADVVRGWMIGSGVDMPTPLIADEAESMVDLIKRTASGGAVGGPPRAVGRLERIAARQRDAYTNPMFSYPFKSTRGTAQDVYGPAWSIYWLSIPFGLGVYTYGMNWIFARHKRRSGGAARTAR